MVLLKSTGRLTKDICEIVGIKSRHQVNSWIKKYKQHYSEQGIAVLFNQPGQGRKPIFELSQDQSRVEKAIKKERQRLTVAKSILEKEMDKPLGLKKHVSVF